MYEEELYSNCHTLIQLILSNPVHFQIPQSTIFAVNVINGNW